MYQVVQQCKCKCLQVFKIYKNSIKEEKSIIINTLQHIMKIYYNCAIKPASWKFGIN